MTVTLFELKYPFIFFDIEHPIDVHMVIIVEKLRRWHAVWKMTIFIRPSSSQNILRYINPLLDFSQMT